MRTKNANEMKKEHARFRRGCRCVKSALFHNRRVKAWRVPGTPEHGKDHMFRAMLDRLN